jgi:hypothetical protein
MSDSYTPITASDISFSTFAADIQLFTDTSSLSSAQLMWLMNFFTSSNSSCKTGSYSGSTEIPTLSATDVSGNEDGKIMLNIDSSVSNTKEALFTLITGIPEGSKLSSGTYVKFLNAWIVKGDDINHLAITPPKNYSGDIQLNVMAIGVVNNKFSLTTTNFDLTVNEVADAPTLRTHNAHGYDHEPIDLDISGNLRDSDGETLTYKIIGIPDGTTLNHGVLNLDGSWTLSASDVVGLQLTSASAQEFTLTVQAIATVNSGDNAGSTSISQKIIKIDVDHLKFVPVLVVSNTSGNEDTLISIDSGGDVHLDVKFLDKNGNDVDHSKESYQEKLEGTTVLISGLPAGATLNHGELQADGSYLLQYSDLAGLTLTPPEDFSGTIDLSIIAIYRSDSDDDCGQIYMSLPSLLHIDIVAVADAPTLSVTDASGDEDVPR